jgi:glycine dehydrogenase subunit 2
MYGKEHLDNWIKVLAQISDEAYSNPELVKTAPHNQAIHRPKGNLDDPSQWAMTWRVHQRKQQAAGATTQGQLDPRR